MASYGLDPWLVLDEEDEFKMQLLGGVMKRVEQIERIRQENLARRIGRALMGE